MEGGSSGGRRGGYTDIILLSQIKVKIIYDDDDASYVQQARSHYRL